LRCICEVPAAIVAARAIVPLHVEFHAVAEPAEDLHAGIGRLHIGLGRKQFGHGDFTQRVLAGGDQRCGAQSQRPCSLDFGLHVRQHVGDRLKGADRASELLALARIVQREFECAARAAAIAGGREHPLGLQA